MKRPVPHRGRPKPHHVAAALRGVDQERQRQPGLRADRVVRLEPPRILLIPRRDALRPFGAQIADLPRRVVFDDLVLDAGLKNGPQSLHHAVGRLGLGDGPAHRLNLPHPHLVRDPLAVRLAYPIEDLAPWLLGCSGPIG
jgi:hypothetical protein